MMKSKYKLIKQIDEADCGSASLATVCSFYGKTVDLADIRRLAHANRCGTNMLGLCDAARALHFNAEGLSGSFKDLQSSNLTFPCIAHVIMDNTLEHFVVIFELNEKEVLVGDPAKGIALYTPEKFQEIWTGHILHLSPGNTFQTERKKAHLLLPFFKLVGQHKKELVIIAILSFVATFFSIAVNFFIYYLIDVIAYSWAERLIAVSAAIVFIYLIILAVNIIRTKLISAVSKEMGQNLMRHYVSHILHVEYEFYDLHTTGDLLSRLQDTDIIRDAISKVTVTALLDVFMALAGLFILAYLNITLFIISFGIILVYAIVVISFNRPIHRITSELREHDAGATTTFLETAKGAEIIRAYQAENHFFNANKEKITLLMRSLQNTTILFSEQSIFAESIMSIGEILMLAVGGIGIISKTLTIGTLVLFYALFHMCLKPARNLIDLLPIIHKAKVSAQRLHDVFSSKQEADEPPKVDMSLDADIDISNLTFRYGNNTPTLDRFSLNIKCGEKIAIIGTNGSGKSTFVKLLLRLQTAECGEIKFGDIEINMIPIATLRKKIAYVSQDTVLFRGSVLDNIRLGNPDMTDDAIITLLNETPVSRFIAQLPMGYQSILSENGENLSGGQRQMISLARALIKQADVLILDEATSALDEQAANVFLAAAYSVYRNKTVIVITHHYCNEQHDRIAVMAHGKIEKIGTYNEIFEKN